MSVQNPIPDVGQVSEANRRSIDEYLRRREVRASTAPKGIPRRPAGEPIPLSFSQQQVWLHSKMAGNTSVYNEVITIARTGPLDTGVLERCLAEIVRRHEIWRTTFDAKDGQPFQVVHPASDQFPLIGYDLRSLSESERAVESTSLAVQTARGPFDLKNGPLFRATLARTQDEEYRLYVTFHQIVFDAVSAYRVFLPELTALYEAFSAGRPSPLAEPLLQYGDVAYWQQKTLMADDWSRQLSFWRAHLSGELPALQWPNEGARPAYQTHRGAIHRFKFDSKVIEPLTSFCQQEGISSYMACLAGYAALLSRYTGQQDIVIGGLSAGRRRSETELTVGYFVNPLALRIDLSGNPSFRDLVRQVRGTVLDALANDEVPFEKIVEDLGLRPDPSRNPIFQLILSQQPKVPAFAPGWDLITEEVSNGGSKLDMTIVLDERPDAISGPITYNPDLFDASTITRLVQHWQTLLAGAVAAPDRSIAELPLLTDSERQQILVDWNSTRGQCPKNQCVHELFDAQVDRVPDAIALKFKDEETTYGALGARSNQLAHCLQNLGAGPDTPVGLYLGRSSETVVGLLGVLKAGAACLPLDPTYPADRLSFMLAETRAPILLTTTALEPQLPQHNARVVCLDADPQLRSMQDNSIALSPVGGDNLAYIIYTSGSTGRPKGVQVKHGGLVNSTLARSTYYKDPVGRFLLLPSFAFDSSLAGIFWTLSTGGTLVLPPDESRCDLTGLVELMVRHGVSHVLCVPTLYRQLLEEASLDRVSSLRVAIVAGEECSKELVENHYRSNPRAVLFNEYGPTEATVWSSVYRCEPGSRLARVPIGRPIANAQLYILDSHLQPVPVGIRGELHIAGAGITRGYLNQAELTSQKFVFNPFNDQQSGSLYKTGDLARYLPDGNIEYLGRVDQQVKIRGFRIELGEIEATLRACPNVRAAVVSIPDDARGDKRLVAHVVPETRPEVTATGLRDHLKRKLPAYMIPDAFVFLDALPLSSNGKIDRRALSVSMPDQDESSAIGFVAPRDDLETRLAKIWEEVLGIKKVGIRNNLFDLGAHSLVIARLLARIEREFGRRMAFASVFEAPTIELFAGLLRKTSAPAQFTEVIPIQTAGSKPPFFGIGWGFLWRPLSEHLGADQPMLCVDFDESIVGQLHKPYSLEEFAGYIVRAIREYCPQGPYFLGGFCDNAMLAYEAARQLLEQGHQVKLLTIIGARNHSYFRGSPYHAARKPLWQRAASKILELRKLKKTEAVLYAAELLKKAWRRAIRRAQESFARARARRNSTNLTNLEQILRFVRAMHRPKPYGGRVALLRDDTTKLDGALSGWRDVLRGPVETHDVPGNHTGIFFEPHVQHLANRLALSLQNAAAPSTDRKNPGER
jgi:amino acid adenylation domain-containing protein